MLYGLRQEASAYTAASVGDSERVACGEIEGSAGASGQIALCSGAFSSNLREPLNLLFIRVPEGELIVNSNTTRVRIGREEICRRS